MKLLFYLLFPVIILGQQSIEEELDSAYINAKKGIYWALSNISPGKNLPGKELIADNKLYSTVKLSMEVDGVKIESKGYHNSVEVTLKLYRSDDYLKREGYLKEKIPEESIKKKRKL